MSKLCLHCGQELPDCLKFCTNCGQKLPSEPILPPASDSVLQTPIDEPASDSLGFIRKETESADITKPVPPELSSDVLVITAPVITINGRTEPLKTAARFCSFCGQELQSGAVFCSDCGQRVNRELSATAESRAAVIPQVRYSDEKNGNTNTADKAVRNILLQYGTKRMLLRKLPFVLVMIAITAGIYALCGSARSWNGYLVGNILSAPLLAFMMWRVYRQPARYAAKRKRALKKNGCTASEIINISKENPIFTKKIPMEIRKAKRLAGIGMFIGLLGILLWLYGLFALLLPIFSSILVPHDFNYILFMKGLHIFTVGLLMGYFQKIIRGITKT